MTIIICDNIFMYLLFTNYVLATDKKNRGVKLQPLSNPILFFVHVLFLNKKRKTKSTLDTMENIIGMANYMVFRLLAYSKHFSTIKPFPTE